MTVRIHLSVVLPSTSYTYLQRRAIRADEEAPIWVGGEVSHWNSVLVSIVSQVISWAGPVDCCLFIRRYRLGTAVPYEDSTGGPSGRHQHTPRGVLQRVATQVAGVVTTIVV